MTDPRDRQLAELLVDTCVALRDVSSIHWDIVKDLRRPGSRLELDGDVVQQDDAWLI